MFVTQKRNTSSDKSTRTACDNETKKQKQKKRTKIVSAEAILDFNFFLIKIKRYNPITHALTIIGSAFFCLFCFFFSPIFPVVEVTKMNLKKEKKIFHIDKKEKQW